MDGYLCRHHDIATNIFYTTIFDISSRQWKTKKIIRGITIFFNRWFIYWRSSKYRWFKGWNRKGTKYEDLAAKLNEIIEKNSLTDEIKIREEERGIVLQVDESILFDSGKAEIKDSSIHVLDTIAKIIQETDNEIVAEGNTDNVPINSAAYRSNWELSTERALSIVRYLIENKNINPNRISLKGYGEFNPIVPNDTPENKAKNRRVDILVVEERESKTENKNNNVENK